MLLSGNIRLPAVRPSYGVPKTLLPDDRYNRISPDDSPLNRTELPLMSHSTPQWIQDLTHAVTEEIYPFDILSPVGCHYHRGETQWEVTIFASSTELIGGPRDGLRTSSKFSLNLTGVHGILDRVTEFRWQPLYVGEGDELGPHISLEGSYDGHELWLRILSEAPADMDPGRIVWANEGRWEEVWK